VTFGEDFNTAMRLEMHHHLYGDPLSEAAEANRRIFRGFYDPQTAEWRNLWSANARAMLARLLSGLEAWGRADASIRA
jgi:hypothetical protein